MHSLDFLEYAYLQIGNDQKAKAEWDELQTVKKEEVQDEFKDYYDSMQAGFAARYALERRQWQEALALQSRRSARASVQALSFWAHAVAAGHLRDAGAAQSAADQFDALLEATRKSDKPQQAKGLANSRDETHAWLAFAQGKNEDALLLLRAVANKQDRV